MSLGYVGACKIELEDDKSVIYSYSSYNLNDDKYRNSDRVYDGTIIIDKLCLIEPEIHERIKRMPNGKKQTIIKRIPKSADIFELIKSGKIRVENSHNTWKKCQDVDYIALHLCNIIFREYQINGMIPKSCSYNV